MWEGPTNGWFNFRPTPWEETHALHYMDDHKFTETQIAIMRITWVCTRHSAYITASLVFYGNPNRGSRYHFEFFLHLRLFSCYGLAFYPQCGGFALFWILLYLVWSCLYILSWRSVFFPKRKQKRGSRSGEEGGWTGDRSGGRRNSD